MKDILTPFRSAILRPKFTETGKAESVDVAIGEDGEDLYVYDRAGLVYPTDWFQPIDAAALELEMAIIHGQRANNVVANIMASVKGI